MKKKILFVVNVDYFFLSHRLPLALHAILNNYSVYVLSKDTGKRKEIESFGITFFDIDFDRSGTNLIHEFKTIVKIIGLYKAINPDIIHHVTIKPSVYGSIIFRFLKNKNLKIVNAISGLGFNFINERKSISQILLLKLMKIGFSGFKVNFIFQNPNDLEFYKSLGFLNSSNYTLIKGAGVDEHIFKYHEIIKKDKIVILLPARMLFDKGIIEFCEAAKILKINWYGKVKFILAGDIDNNNLARIEKEQLLNLLIPNYLEWIGYSENIIEQLIISDIVCLPSYREGLPKSLIEAMAIGRPIVTTNAPGCKECVNDFYNGILVPIKDSKSLADKIEYLLLNENIRITMGLNSRAKMVNELSLSRVIEQTFEFYNRLS